MSVRTESYHTCVGGGAVPITYPRDTVIRYRVLDPYAIRWVRRTRQPFTIRGRCGREGLSDAGVVRFGEAKTHGNHRCAGDGSSESEGRGTCCRPCSGRAHQAAWLYGVACLRRERAGKTKHKRSPHRFQQPTWCELDHERTTPRGSPRLRSAPTPAITPGCPTLPACHTLELHAS